MLALQLAQVLPQTLAQYPSSMLLVARRDAFPGGCPLTPAFLSEPATKGTSITGSQHRSVLPHCSPLGNLSVHSDNNSDLKTANNDFMCLHGIYFHAA